MYTDSKSLHDAINSVKNALERRLKIDTATLWELFKQRVITSIIHIKTEEQIAKAWKKRVHQQTADDYIARKSYFIVISRIVLRQRIKLKWVDPVTGMMVMHVTKGEIFK